MSDFLWYSRLAVWAGALVLFAQALAGRGTSPLTALATICLALGFVSFLVALALNGRAAAAAKSSSSDEGDPRGGPSKP